MGESKAPYQLEDKPCSWVTHAESNPKSHWHNYLLYALALKFLHSCLNVSLTFDHGCNLTLNSITPGNVIFASFQAGLNNRPLAETSLKRSSTLHLPEQQGPGEAGTPERGCSVFGACLAHSNETQSTRMSVSQQPLLLMLIALSWCPIAGRKSLCSSPLFLFIFPSIIRNMLTQIK